MLFTPPPRNSAQTRVNALGCVFAALLTFFLAGSEYAQSSGFPAHPVIPAKAGIQTPPAIIAESAIHRGAQVVLDSRFRGNDKLGEWKRAELRRLLGEWEKRAGLAVGNAAVSRFGFVKKARVDFQTSLGGRKGQFAIDAIGGLRERGDDVIGWHLRGYAGEENARGGNAGLFWRVVKGESLLGANAFLDYERDENAGGFWRWSFGAEWKNKYGELSANRYWAITEGKQLADGFYYTREGFDADMYLRAPGLEWAALRGGYYQWKGERGDGDDEGFRYGLRLSPGGGVFVEAEFDEESGDFGGSFSYSHTFGEASAGAEKADGFNPRLHFYDSARREYSQRISRAGVGVSQFAAVLVTSDLSVDITVGAMATAFARTTTQINYTFPLTSDVNIGVFAPGNKAFFRQQAGGWNLTLNANSRAAILQTARILEVISGGGEFERFGNNRLATVIMPGATFALLGTRFSWNIDGGITRITLHEGGISSPEALPGAVIVMTAASGATLIIGGQVARGVALPPPGEFAGAALTVTTRIAAANIATVTAAGGSGFTYSFLNAPSDITFAIGASDGEIAFNPVPRATLAERNITLTVAASGRNPGNENQTATVELILAIVDPPALTVEFNGDVNFTRLTVAAGTNITVGTLVLRGGQPGAGRAISLIGGTPTAGFDLQGGTLLFFTDADSEGAVSVTVSGNDSHDNTPAALLTVTVDLVAGFALPPPEGDVLMVTTHTDYNPLVQFAAGGGTDIRYGLFNAPASPTFAIDANNGELRFATNPHLPIDVTVTATASGQPPVGQRQTATAAVTLAIVNPPQLTIGFDGTPSLSLVTAAGAADIGNITISGGDNQNALVFAGAANGFAFANNTVLVVANAAVAGRYTTTIRASNPHPNVADKFLTAAVTLFSLRIMTMTTTVTTGFSDATVFEGNITATAGNRALGNRGELVWLNPVMQAVTAANGTAVFTGQDNTHQWIAPVLPDGTRAPWDAATGHLHLIPRTVTIGNLTVTEMTTTMTATVAPDSGFFGMLQTKSADDFAFIKFSDSPVVAAADFITNCHSRESGNPARFCLFRRIVLDSRFRGNDKEGGNDRLLLR